MMWACRLEADLRRSGVPGDVARGDGGGEVVLVGPDVVVLTDQREVEQGGGSAVDPVDDVVRGAPLGWAPAAGEGAALVSGPQCGQQGWGDQAFGSSDVQGLALSLIHISEP